MSNMPTSLLARCIAPCIDLRLGGEESNDVVHENVELNMNDLRYAIIENIDHYDNKESCTGSIPLLLLDSPRQGMMLNIVATAATKALHSIALLRESYILILIVAIIVAITVIVITVVVICMIEVIVINV